MVAAVVLYPSDAGCRWRLRLVLDDDPAIAEAGAFALPHGIVHTELRRDRQHGRGRFQPIDPHKFATALMDGIDDLSRTPGFSPST